VVTVTMNRPEKKNAANPTMLTELREVFEQVERKQSDRVMVLTGAGGEFCSGADLSDPDAPTTSTKVHGLVRMRRLGDLALALHRMSKPTIAKIDGVAVGAGCGLALGCDLLVASDRARLSLIFSRRGMSLDNGSSWILPRLVGMARAKEIAFFADILSAQDALAFGLLNRVVPVGELDAFVDDWAKRLAQGPPLALSMTKTLLQGAWSSSMQETLEDEARCQAINYGTEDLKEAMAAFKEKRDPTFTGR
jgi:2-(1,2-epoxy-1,2-dihydrophenyl)acetyl-CoA isomerase